MSTLHFLNYNNYQNRVLKGEDLTSTSSYSISKSYSNLNFNPNDGINTVHYINDPVTNSFNYDYCLVTNDDSTTILSKWFVMDAVWNRKHQWEVELKRDVKADFYNTYKSKPFFCKKGVPYGAGDVLCFNSEGQDFNQILKSRTALKQSSGQTGRYIIGFVDKSWPGGKIYNMATVPDETYKQMEDFPYLDYQNSRTMLKKVSLVLSVIGEPQAVVGSNIKFTGHKCSMWHRWSINNGVATHDADSSPMWTSGTSEGYIACSNLNESNLSLFFNEFVNMGFNPSIITHIQGFDNDYIPKNIKNRYSGNGKKALIGDKLYTIKYKKSSTVSFIVDNLFPSGYLEDLKSDGFNIIYSQSNGIQDCYYECYAEQEWLEIAEDTSATYSTIPANRGSSSSKNLPYDIFVIPESDNAMRWATYFASLYGGANVLYDLQLFPYKPSTSSTGGISAIGLEWATSDRGFGNCSHAAIASYSSMSDKKVGANQHMCRMISPNGASAWEFNPATIGGVAANSIKYEFTLIPFNSYLHIFPTFGGIYGSINKSSGDKNGETRGMICSGPWSLPYSTDNWSTYQLNNSAYMDSFNRQIENMTVTQDIDRAQQMFQMFTAPITGMFMGAMGGGVAGAALGAGAGLIGSVADYQLSEVGRKETIDYTRDQFYNSLRNIKAQARPLAHNSSITIGNSYWPIIEYYEADVSGSTDMRDYLLGDLRVHGWTMGIKTTFETMKERASSSTSNYIQGHLLQINNAEDTHIANEVMKELEKGVYINGI